MLLRMALNALDGMVAQASNHKTVTGAVLNELCDVISDAALFSAFLVILVSIREGWWLLTLLALFTEFVSLSVYQAEGVRPHSGPFGKSDRAVYLGLLAVLLAIFPTTMDSPTNWLIAYCALGVLLAILTIWNRFAFIKTKQ